MKFFFKKSLASKISASRTTVCSRNLRKKSRGTALLETIAAIVILSIALLAGTKLIVGMMQQTALLQSRFVATYLSQECLELARNHRDSSWKRFLDWKTDFSDGNYRISADAGTPTKIKIEPDDGSVEFFRVFRKNSNFVHGYGDFTGFSRKMTTSGVANGVKIVCETSWGRGKVQISEILTDWRK